MKTSLIATVYNEEESIRKYLDSLKAQTVKPTEIIIVDAGSTDGTVEIINSYKRKLPIRIIIEKGATIPKAENIAIKASKYNTIVGGCAGITMPKDWLENLLSYFDKDTDIVSGVYKLTGRTTLQKAIADVFQYGLLPDINEATDDFNPSNRSLAYRKRIWKKLGKYPEHLNRADDTWFNIEARKHGFKFKIAKKAIVYWEARKNLRETFKYSYLDIKCDVQHKINTKRYIKYWIDLFAIIISFLISFPLFYIIILLNLAYLFHYSINISATNGRPSRIPSYFIIMVVIMASTFSGMIGGWLQR